VADRTLALPAQLLRRLIAPAALAAVLGVIGAAFTALLRRTREPALPRMSEEWLRHLDHDTGRGLETWRDSW